jgi:23S rRNA (adenine2503-C2)-methyltransferase
MMKQDIKNLDFAQLQEYLREHKQPAFHAGQVFGWIYKKGVRTFSEMSDLSAALRKKLDEDFYIYGTRIYKKLDSIDGTQKFLIELNDANLIESVSIPTERRVTGCISSQVGCKYACRFCASGLVGFKRNLSCGEMLEEVLLLNAAKKLTHIVFMGTGEPLDNYDELLKAIRIINSAEALTIGARRITISTCGVIPGIKRLAQEDLQVELSVSLHSANDLTRSMLMPANKVFPLKELISVCGEYIKKTKRQVTFEYILIKGRNSDLQSAQKLATILKPLRLCKVNLIPANPVKELNLEPPGKLEMLLFKDRLLKQGLNVTLRKERGRDIDAACGQLRLRHEKK